MKVFLFIPRLLPILFLNLVLQETPKHIFFLIHPYYFFPLLLVDSLLVGLNFLFFELVSLCFSFPIYQPSLVLIDALELLLVLDELVVVLFIY